MAENKETQSEMKSFNFSLELMFKKLETFLSMIISQEFI